MKAWYVFKQDTKNKPHQMVGSVHAVDAETALLEARTVFARRPKAVSMWVVPKDQVRMWTKEALDADSQTAVAATLSPEASSPVEESAMVERSPWHVFRKTGQRRSMTFVDHVGSVAATSAETALTLAFNQFNDGDTVWVWMIVPDSAIARSDEEDVDSWFTPALSKTYKQQSQYGFVGARRGKRP